MTLHECQHTETIELGGKQEDYSLYRRSLADQWIDKVEGEVRAYLERQYRQAADRLEDGLEHIRQELKPSWHKRGMKVKLPILMKVAAEGYNNIEGKQMQLGIDPEEGISDALLAGRVRPPIEDYVDKTVQMETDTTMKQVRETLRQGREEQLTIDEISDQLIEKGATQSATRAENISRTSTIWANNEGSVLGYQDDGVPLLQWQVTADDRTCPLCLSMQGQKIKTGANFVDEGGTVTGTDGSQYETAFAVGHPPLHPRCRCVVLPIYE